jgi:hypothetical protein
VSRPRPEPGVSYAVAPSEEHRAANRLEAITSLARFLGVTEERAADCLAHPGAYEAELRAHMTLRQARRETERRYAPRA